ncbi:MAG: ankyrin repeat domain-containing protein [Pyrinomonadaceae bacterium]
MRISTRAGYVAVGLVTFFIGVAAVASYHGRHHARLKAWPKEPQIAFQSQNNEQAHPCKAGYYVWIPEVDERYGDVYDPYCYPLQTKLSTAASEGNLAEVRAALQAGANVNGHLDDSAPPLPLAVSNSHTEVARLLLDNGAEINIGNGLHWPPLYNAIYRHDTETVNLLLARGAKFTWACDFDGHRLRTPLQFAEEQGYDDIAELLDEAGASNWQHRLNRRIAKLIGNRYRQIFRE